MAEWILKTIRQSLGLEPDDTSRDNEIEIMTHEEIFDHWLQWHGIIGYTKSILNAIETIYVIDLEGGE